MLVATAVSSTAIRAIIPGRRSPPAPSFCTMLRDIIGGPVLSSAVPVTPFLRIVLFRHGLEEFVPRFPVAEKWSEFILAGFGSDRQPSELAWRGHPYEDGCTATLKMCREVSYSVTDYT